MFKAFDPDPDITDPSDPEWGTGMWHYADGGSAYGKGDPDEASALYQPPAAPDMRTAQADDLPPMGPPVAPVPGQEALNANEPQADVGPPPMLARPPEPVSSGVDGSMRASPENETGGIRIPRESRIAYVHNNPGNLKYVGQEGAHQGEPAEDGGHWAAFETPEQGIAALNRQVEIDAGRGQTVREFISKYAPPGSNDTEGYIRSASESLGADPDAKLSDIDRGKVVAFMARKESGTELGGTSLPDQAQARRATPAGIPGGLRPAVAEMRGMPLSPEQIQHRQQGVYDQTMAAAGTVQNAAQERIKGRDEALKIVSDQHERFKADQQQQLAQATATRQEAERNVQQAMATQLDPGRIIKHMSTGDMVLGAVALMLGGLGQTLQQRGGQRGATNSAVAMLEKALDQDLEQQKEDKKSRVAHWTRVFGDAEMGIKAARAEMYNAAGQFAQFQAQSKATNADIQAQAMQDAATLIGKGQAEAQGLVDRENDRLSIRYQQPDPNANGATEKLAESLKLDQSLEQSGYNREQRERMLAKLGLPPPAGESVREQKSREEKEQRAHDAKKMTEPQAKAADTRKSLDALGTKAGLVRNPSTGQWEEGEGIAPPAFWEGLKSTVTLGSTATPINDALEAAVEAYGRFRSGGVIGKDERPAFREQLGAHTFTRAQLAAKLNAAEGTISNQLSEEERKKGTAAPSAWR